MISDFMPKSIADLEEIAYARKDWPRKRKYLTFVNNEKSDRYEEVWLNEFTKIGFKLSKTDKKQKNPERVVTVPFSGGIEIKTIFGDDVELLKNNNIITPPNYDEIERATKEKIEDAMKQLAKYEVKIIVLVYGFLYDFKNSFSWYANVATISELLKKYSVDVLIFSVAPISLNSKDSWCIYPPKIYLKDSNYKEIFTKLPFELTVLQ